MAVDFARVQAFIERVDDAFVERGDGKWEVSPDELRRLAREDSELFILACRSWVLRAQHGGAKQRGNGQVAMTLASIYSVEYDDDALEIAIRNELAALGIRVPVPDVVPVHQTSGPASDQRLRIVQIDADTLRRQDTYTLVRVFGHHNAQDEQSRAQLRGLRALCALTFPVPMTDAREVWEVPEVRAFVERLNESLPYLPYFLGRRSNIDALSVWWLCLAPDEAVLPGGGLDLDNNELTAQFGYSAYVTSRFALLVDDDPDVVRRELFTGFPTEYVSHVWRLADGLAALESDAD